MSLHYYGSLDAFLEEMLKYDSENTTLTLSVCIRVFLLLFSKVLSGLVKSCSEEVKKSSSKASATLTFVNFKHLQHSSLQELWSISSLLKWKLHSMEGLNWWNFELATRGCKLPVLFGHTSFLYSCLWCFVVSGTSFPQTLAIEMVKFAFPHKVILMCKNCSLQHQARQLCPFSIIKAHLCLSCFIVFILKKKRN